MRLTCRGVVIDFAELSDPGREPTKQINEDAAGFAQTSVGHLAVVCDGMGGHSAGREASTQGLGTVLEVAQEPGVDEPRARLSRAVTEAAKTVWTVGGDAPQELRPGSTCVAVLLHEGGAEVAHVGDSRVYLVRGGTARRLTRDHSMVQQMIDAGMLSEADAAEHPDSNKITRALGMTPTVEVELCASTIAVQNGDTLLLCTDGLTDLVDDAEIGAVVAREGATGPEPICRTLVAMANQRGGHDNITVQVLQIVSMPKTAAPTTVVMDGTAPRTVIDEAPVRPGRTLPDAAPLTVIDEPEPRAERTTLPGDAPPTAKPADLAGALAEVPTGARPGVSARALVLAAAGVAAAIVVGVGVWWVSSAVPRPTQDDTPPPPPEPATERSTTVLEPLPPPSAEPVVPPLVLHEAGADATPDAALESGSAIP